MAAIFQSEKACYNKATEPGLAGDAAARFDKTRRCRQEKINESLKAVALCKDPNPKAVIIFIGAKRTLKPKPLLLPGKH